MILEPKKVKSVIVSIVSLSIWHEVMGLDARFFIGSSNKEIQEDRKTDASLDPLNFAGNQG